MAAIERRAVYIQLEEISSKSGLTRVIFSMKRKSVVLPSSYVSFNFQNFDLMYTHLKSMARIYKACSIENLYANSFPAKVEISKNFNSPDTFDTLYLTPDGIVEDEEKTENSKMDYYANLYTSKYIPKEYLWPSNGVKGFFLLDDDI